MSLDVSRYRWSRAFGLRWFGAAVIVVAVLWVVAAFTGFAGWALALAGIAALVALACLLFLVVLPPTLIEVSSQGYRVRRVRGAGATEATWRDVVSVTGGSAADGAVLSITLRDDRVTLVPLALLGDQAVVAERDIHNRLNAIFGYRRLHEG